MTYDEFRGTLSSFEQTEWLEAASGLDSIDAATLYAELDEDEFGVVFELSGQLDKEEFRAVLQVMVRLADRIEGL